MHALQCSSHAYTEYMQIVMYLHNYEYKLYIPLLLLRKFNAETSTTENLCIQLPGCLASSKNYSFQCENNKVVIVKMYAV